MFITLQKKNDLKFLKYNYYLGLAFFIKVLLTIYALSLTSSKNNFLLNKQYFVLVDVICSFLSAFCILKIYNHKSKSKLLIYLFCASITFNLFYFFREIVFSFLLYLLFLFIATPLSPSIIFPFIKRKIQF